MRCLLERRCDLLIMQRRMHYADITLYYVMLEDSCFFYVNFHVKFIMYNVCKYEAQFETFIECQMGSRGHHCGKSWMRGEEQKIVHMFT